MEKIKWKDIKAKRNALKSNGTTGGGGGHGDDDTTFGEL
jgi:hypothetical protein